MSVSHICNGALHVRGHTLEQHVVNSEVFPCSCLGHVTPNEVAKQNA